MNTIQQAAAIVISKVIGGRNLNQVLSETLKTYPHFSVQERGALMDLSYGTLRFYGQISGLLDLLLNKPVHDVHIRYLLLIALYQLQHSKAAPYAVVDFAVNAVRNHTPAASGLANAILRNFLRKRDTLLKTVEKSEEGLYSYPQWWITEVKLQYGTKKASSILKSGNQHPPMTLRVNEKKTTATDYLYLLAQNNIAAQIIAPNSIMLKQPQSVDQLPGFLDGVVSVQDAGAQYAKQFLDVENGMRVLDACAAPGGKSAHLLEAYQLELFALDKDAGRLERIRENMSRLRLSANLIIGDASKPADWWDGRLFQRILADVPCSATGVVRRHPDIKWLRRLSDLESFAKIQEEILNALWPLLETTGKLLYVTCSIFDRENQKVIDNFLSQHPNAKQLDLNAAGMEKGQFIPNDLNDGFFYALLYKKL